ncbi:hypothetical protein PR202_ga07215 [Eleusine coracana subsp. coracana]|uniref:Glabrous enhancer-binding protein-like DBD domain-containing protein n=1 Tax=Eleusine coracana subsp. coracana TaxID=191504 RepID=A0AAV5BY57_ELECO|nr:hypothetical protein PR202_ga07215 [Eleusine coracana subsp. coracana]
MPRKRPAPSPAPPPPPPPLSPQESSTESGSDTEEEEPPRAAAAPKPPQNSQPHPTAAAADGDDSSEAESDSDADAQAFQMRPVSRSPTKPVAPAPQPESDADEEEGDGESSESEPEIPEPVQKKAVATKESKTVDQEDKKRPAPEPASSGKGKKAKADPEKAKKPGDKLEDKRRPAPEPAPSGKGKKTKADPEKAKKPGDKLEDKKMPAPESAPSGKGKKANKPGDKLEKSGLDSPPPSSKSEKSARVNRTWSKEDLFKILEAMAAHVKREGALPKTDVLLAAVRDHLERKDCSYADLYNKIRHFKQRYEQIATMRSVPGGEDELRIYNLSEAIWGGKTKVVTDQNGDSQKGSGKGHAIQMKTDRNVKSKLSKEDITALTPSKSKKQGNGKEELGKDAKNGTSKETATTATQNGDALTKRKRGKMDKDKMDIDLILKASTGSQTGTNEETHEEETEIGSCVQRMRRSFDDLQNLYPNLAWCVERIEAQQPCGETLKRAFEFIGDEKAIALESKIKDQRSLEVKAQIYRDDLRKKVVNMLMGLMD